MAAYMDSRIIPRIVRGAAVFFKTSAFCIGLSLADYGAASGKESLPARTGFLVIAPDRGFLGNQETRELFAEFKSTHPAVLAFAGREYAGTGGDYSGYLTQAIEELGRNGISDIVAVPLFLSAEDPWLKKAAARLAGKVRFAPSMAQSHLTAQILLDRTAALSRDPAQERLVIVGSGAIDEPGELAMRGELERLGSYVTRYLPFKEVRVGIYYGREAEAGLQSRKNQAVDDLVMRTAAKKGRTLVIPFFIGAKYDSHMSAVNGLKEKFAELDIAWDGQEILPHPNALLFLKKTANNHLPPTPDKVGIVIMPHGANQPYNDAVEQVVAPLRSRYRIEMAYGMADPVTISRAVSRLEQQGVGHIVFVRMYAVSPQMKAASDYILGLSDVPPGQGHDHGDAHDPADAAPPSQVRSAAVFSTFGGYEEDPAIAGILYERIMEVSKTPQQETVIVLAHGSERDEDDEKWRTVINGHIERLRTRREQASDLPRFRGIHAATIREDWPEKREQAIARLKEMIRQGNRDGGRTLLISHRLYGGGPYRSFLKGEEFTMNDKGFAPHPVLTRWLERGIANAIRDMKDMKPQTHRINDSKEKHHE